MKNDRKIEVGQVREIPSNFGNIMYFIKSIDDNFVWIKEINTGDEKVYRWDKSSCDYDIVVM